MKTVDLKEAIRSAWGKDTSYQPDEWTKDNPAVGQCAVTALVVQDHLGGSIKRGYFTDSSKKTSEGTLKCGWVELTGGGRIWSPIGCGPGAMGPSHCVCCQSTHYWNVVDGAVMDMTFDQFCRPVIFSHQKEVSRVHLLSNQDTLVRYEILRSRVDLALSGRAKSNFQDVGDFHRRFGLPDVSPDGLTHPDVVDDSVFLFRYHFLQEELVELMHAHRTRDLPKVADALVDLVYVALGTAHMYGVPFDEVWDAVHAANMKKVRASASGDSKRASALDVVKPPGWVPPDVHKILVQCGWTPGR